MKSVFSICLSLCLFFGTGILSYSQVTNLIVNGSTTNFTMTSGDTVTWQFSLPTGATANVGLWNDVNMNGTIEPEIDVKSLPFAVTDGDMNSNNGPPDMDGSVNGQIYFQMPVGIAPGYWIFEALHNSVGQIVSFQVLHLGAPAHTISGHITAPGGQSAKNILVGIEPQMAQKTFWHALTDSIGNYAIEMNDDTAGNPWKIQLIRESNPFPEYILSPENYLITITGNHSGFDFEFIASAAKIVGYLKDDDGNAIANYGMWLGKLNGGSDFSRDAQTDSTGFFQFGLAPSELANDDFQISSSFDNEVASHEYLAATRTIHGVHSNDSLFYNIVAYRVNASIQGHVLVNGNPPGFPIQIAGNVYDTAWTTTWADSTTGNFSLEASNKLFNYSLWANNLPSNYIISNVTAHPGETGVVVNITVTGIDEGEPDIPAAFSLSQNYPNPFNPSTIIEYHISKTSAVNLSIYNILGEKVLTAVQQQQSPGKYKVNINSSMLPGGIYMYRLKTETFSSIRKMIIIK